MNCLRTYRLASLFLYMVISCGMAGCDPMQTAEPSRAIEVTHFGVSYKLTPVVLNPGEEATLCEYFPPDDISSGRAGSEALFLNQFIIDLQPGSHHLAVFRVRHSKNTEQLKRGPVPCSLFTFPPGFDGFITAAQQSHTEAELPAGVAMKIEPAHGLFFQQHFINATTHPITTGATWRAKTMAPADVKSIAGTLYYSNFGLSVPPGMSQATQACAAPSNMNLVLAAGHMHQRGIRFEAEVAGMPIYSSDRWGEPELKRLPGMGLSVMAGTPIRWTCIYKNETNRTFPFGESAIDNEMCNFATIYYPSKNGETDLLCIPVN